MSENGLDCRSHTTWLGKVYHCCPERVSLVVLALRRLLNKDVESSPATETRLEVPEERLFVNDPAAGDVDEPNPFLALEEDGVVDQIYKQSQKSESKIRINSFF